MPRRKKNGYESLDKREKINLGPYSVVKEEGDWEKGFKIALDEVLRRLAPPREVRERAYEVKELVINTLEEFSGKSRIGIAAGIVYFSYGVEGEEIDRKDVVKKAGISGATLKGYLEIIEKLWED